MHGCHSPRAGQAARLGVSGGWAQLTRSQHPRAPHPQGLSGKQPLPSATGTAAVTEAGQRLTLYSGADGAPGRVQTGGPEVLDTYTILSQTSGCRVTALQIDGALAGLPVKAAR